MGYWDSSRLLYHFVSPCGPTSEHLQGTGSDGPDVTNQNEDACRTAGAPNGREVPPWIDCSSSSSSLGSSIVIVISSKQQGRGTGQGHGSVLPQNAPARIQKGRQHGQPGQTGRFSRKIGVKAMQWQ